MANYQPPTENLPVFNSTVFKDANTESLSLSKAQSLFLGRTGTPTSVATATTFNANITANSLKLGTQGSGTVADKNIIVSLGTGIPALATGTKNVVLGSSIGLTTGSYNIAIGSNSLPNNIIGNNNVAIGLNAGQGATADSNTSIGTGTNIGGGVSGSTAIGSGATTTLSNQIMLGTSSNTVYCSGTSTNSLVASNPIAVGNSAGGTGFIQLQTDGVYQSGTVSLGYNNSVGSGGSVAIGVSCGVGGSGVAIGNNTISGVQGVAIGYGAVINAGANSVAVGYSANASNASGSQVAVGRSANATGQASVSIGSLSSATGQNSTAVGASSQAQAFGSTAIGSGAIATLANSIVLGTVTETVYCENLNSGAATGGITSRVYNLTDYSGVGTQYAGTLFQQGANGALRVYNNATIAAASATTFYIQTMTAAKASVDSLVINPTAASFSGSITSAGSITSTGANAFLEIYNTVGGTNNYSFKTNVNANSIDLFMRNDNFAGTPAATAYNFYTYTIGKVLTQSFTILSNAVQMYFPITLQSTYSAPASAGQLGQVVSTSSTSFSVTTATAVSFASFSNLAAGVWAFSYTIDLTIAGGTATATIQSLYMTLTNNGAYSSKVSYGGSTRTHNTVVYAIADNPCFSSALTYSTTATTSFYPTFLISFTGAGATISANGYATATRIG
jgi:hypothetical protein